MDSKPTLPAPKPALTRWKLGWIFTIAPLVFGPLWVCGGHRICQTEMTGWSTFAAAVLILACFGAAIDDTLRMKISNGITYPTFVWLFVLSLAVSFFPTETTKWIGFVGLMDLFPGVAACFLVAFIPYLFGSGGGGDAKLAAVIGAGLGFQYGLIAIGTSFVIAAFLAIGRTVLQKGPLFVVRAIYRRLGSILTFWILPPSREDRLFLKQPLPMGASFFFGVLFTLTGIVPHFILSL